ncbi:peptidase T [Spirosoma utsteinense]|uniref:Peptidase T n=1 Tax=Spirosoma utsteinense TaxID=2585773 RepID=A0ABR6W786_9BACT|nr:peptidase T [Spirosoma utsteinense]MBC3785907.1 tripeptide aminopeptidase [Spirosoma utsteinense]MBC3792079.1 tripeptide aminopeptidase [Spirosoma utsteinense]
MENYTYTALDRFIRYVGIDTQSDPQSTTNPSTEKQKDLSRVLVQELLDMGIADAEMDEWGYVYATIPANTDKASVPVICFCSHVDTSPDVTGAGVKPIIHLKYDGKDIVLPDDNAQIIRVTDHPDLQNQVGNDIVTASGTTLLGADNKAGLAEIMDAANYLITHPDVKHGTIRLLFTPDEEVGRGTEKVDIQKLGADYGYTIDGESLGTLEDETFSADAVKISIKGVSTHPGFAKGKLENAIKIAADVLASLPKDTLSPETTEAKEGFVHPTRLEGNQDQAVLEFIIRDFTESGLHDKEAYLQDQLNTVLARYPGSTAEFVVKEQYRNMKEMLDQHPAVVDNALEAIGRAGLSARQRSIRGGTDGSRLSFMGLPCPNIFAGEHAFHSRQEWVSVQDMQAAVDVIVQVAQVWEERA